MRVVVAQLDEVAVRVEEIDRLAWPLRAGPPYYLEDVLSLAAGVRGAIAFYASMQRMAGSPRGCPR